MYGVAYKFTEITLAAWPGHSEQVQNVGREAARRCCAGCANATGVAAFPPAFIYQQMRASKKLIDFYRGVL